MIANRTWLYLILVGLFVAFIAVLLQYGDQRFGEEAVVERPAIANRAASADSTAANSSFILGALMNTRGLMELIALNVGYDLGMISAEMFTSLVLMALVTTGLTGPMVDLALAYRPNNLGLGSGVQPSAEAGRNS